MPTLFEIENPPSTMTTQDYLERRALAVVTGPVSSVMSGSVAAILRSLDPHFTDTARNADCSGRRALSEIVELLDA